MSSTFKKWTVLLQLDLLISGLSLVLLIAVTFGGVLMRYLFSSPFVWQEEVQLWCFLWVILFGAGAAFRTGSHVAIDFLVERFPNSIRYTVELICYLLVMFVFIYLMHHGMYLIDQFVQTARHTNILDIPYAVIYAALPVGCGIMIIHYSLIIIPTLISGTSKE